jgi:hypothetical protein
MIFSVVIKAAVFTSYVSSVTARLPDGRFHGNVMRRPLMPRILLPKGLTAEPVISKNGTELPPLDTVYEFDQLIDHNNPKLGTFKQRFWHSYEFYEPGVYC